MRGPYHDEAALAVQNDHRTGLGPDGSSQSLKSEAHLLFFTLPVIAQVSPKPSAPAPGSQRLTISWPASIDISPASVANFERSNQGSGTILITVKCDGKKNAMIPPTPDIDGDLRSALMKFVSDTKVTAGTACHDETFIVHFEVPSGNMTETELQPPG